MVTKIVPVDLDSKLITFQADTTRAVRQQPAGSCTAGARGPAAIHEPAHFEKDARLGSRDMAGGRDDVLYAGVG